MSAALDTLSATAARFKAVATPRVQPVDEWEAPLSFAGAELPPFPIDALPTTMSEFVSAEAEATQTPIDMAAMLALAAYAAASAGRAVLQIKPGYSEPLNLFTAVVLPPAERKSQVLRDVVAPLSDWERNESIRMAATIRHAMQRKLLSEKRLRHIEEKAAKCLDPNERANYEAEAQDLGDAFAKLVTPVAPQLLADDATPEALVSLMAQHGGRMAQASAEGGVFEMLAGRYSDAPNLDPYLKGHSGDQIRVSRKGRPDEFIERPTLTVALAVQPAVLDRIAESPVFRGVGLLARFLYSLPSSRLGSRNVDSVPVPAAVRARYHASLERRLTLATDNPLTLRLSREAYAAYVDFARWLEPQLSDVGELSELRDWAGKLPGAVMRIAGIVALESLLESPSLPQEVPLDAVESAVTIGKYLIPHAAAAFAAMGSDPSIEAAKHVWRHVERNEWQTFSRREIQQALKNTKRFEKADAIDAALAVLMDRHFIRLAEVDRKHPTGRKPGATYVVNPLAISKGQYARNPR